MSSTRNSSIHVRSGLEELVMRSDEMRDLAEIVKYRSGISR